jgi:hypothetical protein
MTDYQKKYLKYKNKYLILKNQQRGGGAELATHDGPCTIEMKSRTPWTNLNIMDQTGQFGSADPTFLSVLSHIINKNNSTKIDLTTKHGTFTVAETHIIRCDKGAAAKEAEAKEAKAAKPAKKEAKTPAQLAEQLEIEKTKELVEKIRKQQEYATSSQGQQEAAAREERRRIIEENAKKEKDLLNAIEKLYNNNVDNIEYQAEQQLISNANIDTIHQTIRNFIEGKAIPHYGISYAHKRKPLSDTEIKKMIVGEIQEFINKLKQYSLLKTKFTQ